MRLKRQRLAASIILVLLAPGIFAQDSKPPEDSGRQGRLPYEVVVNPTATIGNLRALFVQVEDDFFRKFNELNIDDDYDVHCYKVLPTGSHIPRRVCEPVFLIALRAENASEYAFNLGGCNTCRKPLPWLMNQRKLRHETEPSFDVLQEKLEDFNRVDPELNAIGAAMAKVKSRIENFSRD